MSNPHSPGKWDTRFGGHLYQGESWEEAAVKEIGEELGLVVEKSRLISGEIYKYDGKDNKEFNKAFYYRFDGDLGELHFADREVEGVKWLSVKEIQNAVEKDSREWTINRMGGFERVVEVLENYLKKFDGH